MAYVLVFLSGVAALIYEVAWGRQLSTFLGITSYAHMTVLACFMAGLAIGAWTLGRMADRVRRPLVLFARLEAGIGLFGICTLALVPLLQKLYVAIAPDDPASWASHAVRLVIAACALLPPTILMGGTLPALVLGLRSRLEPLGRIVAALYGVNTLGAAVGALASGYLLLPTLGVSRSLLAAAVLNFIVALGILARRPSYGGGHRLSAAMSEPPRLSEPPLGKPRRQVLLIGFALSGAAALALQMAWIRGLTQVIGSSVYAFSLTTASYLVGLALGSGLACLAASALARRQMTLRAVALLEGAVGLSVLAGIPVLGRLPELFLAGYRLGVHESFPRLQVFVFILASIVLVVPTLFLGALYPLIASRAPRRPTETGRGLGDALAANSLGTVAGTLLAGLVLLPALGADGLLRAAAVSCCAVAGMLWLVAADLRPLRGMAALGVLTGSILLAAIVPRWDLALMTSGPFINAARFADVTPGPTLRNWLKERSDILYFRDDIEASISVRDIGDERLLVINGKTDGSKKGDRRTQLALAHLPLLSHPQPRRVLLVGLGTGMSGAAIAAHSDVQEIVIAEISESVIEASDFFREENKAILDDQRVRLVKADARNLLLASELAFDVIVSEPSNPWITGVANLFTREFFALARDRLAPGGIMVQWFQTYGMSEKDLKSVLRSFADTFPQVTVWSPQLGDLLLLGSLEPRLLSLDRFRRLLETHRGREQLESIDLLNAAALARMLVLDDRGTRAFAASAPPNTDDHPRVEFSAPRNLYTETTLSNLTAAIEHLNGRTLVAPLTDIGRYRSTPSGAMLFEAVGLSIEIPDAVKARAEWRVNWTPLAGGEGLLEPVAVGNRPAIVLEGDALSIDIERGNEEEEMNTSLLLDRLRDRTPGTDLRSGKLSLRSGEVAVWLIRRSASADHRAMAWSCGSLNGGFSRYVATVETREAVGREALNRLASGFRCRPASS